MTNSAVSLEDIYAAQERICEHICQTPLLENPLLNEALGFRLMVKAESLQYTGAFKLRGALNNITQLTDDEKSRGVFGMSAGNHAQGLAYAAKLFGMQSVILMPSDAPQSKIDKTRSYGAEVLFCDREKDDREMMGRQIAEERGLTLIHSFNNLQTIAGQGTIGLEIKRQTQELGLAPDAIIVNCSGGGLTSGISLTRDLYKQPPEIYAAEPEGFDDAGRSLWQGKLVANQKLSGSISDALLIPQLGTLTFPILKEQKVHGITANDEETQAAMSIAMDAFKLVLEPGGAVGLAAAIRHRTMLKGCNVVVVASGGNVDGDAYLRHVRVGRAYRQKFWPYTL